MNHYIGDTNEMSDTPIMDAVDAKCDELNVMDAICYAVYEGQKLEIKLNAANQRIKRLEEAGDNLHFGWIDGYMNQRRLDEWLKAKEAKL